MRTKYLKQTLWANKLCPSKQTRHFTEAREHVSRKGHQEVSGPATSSQHGHSEQDALLNFVPRSSLDHPLCRNFFSLYRVRSCHVPTCPCCLLSHPCGPLRVWFHLLHPRLSGSCRQQQDLSLTSSKARTTPLLPASSCKPCVPFPNTC